METVEINNNIPVNTEPDTTDTIMEIKHLKKSFGEKSVLKDINLSLKKGENLGVMGKSGTGKSVLIKCIVRLIEADEGEIMVLGKNILKLNGDDLDEVRKQIGFLFQSAALYDSMSVRDNLEFPLKKTGNYSRQEIDDLVNEELENVGLTEAIDKMPTELSGGMRKRIGLARALILKPKIILYDEPTTGLDPITAREISDLILKIQNKHGASSIIITHDLECARISTNRIMLINEGLCVAEGKYEEVEKMDNDWVRSFFNGK